MMMEEKDKIEPKRVYSYRLPHELVAEIKLLSSSTGRKETDIVVSGIQEYVAKFTQPAIQSAS
jgi:predicted DNA-binding protein